LQLLVQGLERAKSDPDRSAVGGYFLTFAEVCMGNRSASDPWRLQSLTPVDVLADYDENPTSFWGGEQSGGAPVQPDGTPVYYRVPESFSNSKNDGERWRWALVQAAEADPALLNTTRLELAALLLGQFGTQTMADSPIGGQTETSGGASGAYAVDTLADNETIARLATGIRRFKLPDEFNPIKIYQTIAAEPKTGKDEQALDALASIFANRRQFDQAAGYLDRCRVLHGAGNDAWRQKQIDQIRNAWGAFEPRSTQPAGRGGTVDFRFRNGRRVHFEAYEVLFDKLLQDVKNYIASGPKEFDWQKSDLSDIGTRLIARNDLQYLGRSVARWDLDLEPEAGHLDKRISVATPLQNAGAYLLVAQMENGNTSRIVVWLDDTVIIKKPMAGETFYFVADARTGQPVARADVELFGWRMVQVKARNEFRVETRRLSVKTDDMGQVRVALANVDDRTGNFQWLITDICL
jgi:hypothetical protein